LVSPTKFKTIDLGEAVHAETDDQFSILDGKFQTSGLSVSRAIAQLQASNHATDIPAKIMK
jgi:hypothetical protein